MKIAVLVPDYDSSDHVLKSLDPSRDPTGADKRNLHNYEVIRISKASAVKQILNLEASHKYDIFLNLCEASWMDDVAGAEVVDALHKINAPYTGADPIFYNLTKQAMKIAANSSHILIPNHKFLDCPEDLTWLKSKTSLKMPLIVKTPNGHDSVGLSEGSVVNSWAELESQVTKMISKFQGALIEEFIEGPEYTVLVVQNPENPGAEPWAFLPVECTFSEMTHKFKHFDVKWRGHNSNIQWAPVNDKKLAEKLKNIAKRVFLACAGTGYGRADFRMDSKSGELYFLEINSNCSIFYADPAEFGSADHILHMDPDGPEKFLDMIFQVALKNREKRRKNVKIDYEPVKGFYVVASRDLELGQIVVSHENRPCYLISREFLESQWKIHEPMKVGWLQTYGYQLSNNIFFTWHEDGNQWLPYNHSCDPSCWLKGLDVVARRPIKKGDDVTLDYATFAFLDQSQCSNEFECFCGEKVCRKIVRPSSDYKLPGFVEKYQGHMADVIQEKLAIKHVQ